MKSSPLKSKGSPAAFAQVCVAGTRVFVERPIYEEFVERLAQFASSLKVGNSLDPATQIERLTTQDLRRAEQASSRGVTEPTAHWFRSAKPVCLGSSEDRGSHTRPQRAGSTK